jgi:hypothetical protein
VQLGLDALALGALGGNLGLDAAVGRLIALELDVLADRLALDAGQAAAGCHRPDDQRQHDHGGDNDRNYQNG